MHAFYLSLSLFAIQSSLCMPLTSNVYLRVLLLKAFDFADNLRYASAPEHCSFSLSLLSAHKVASDSFALVFHIAFAPERFSFLLSLLNAIKRNLFGCLLAFILCGRMRLNNACYLAVLAYALLSLLNDFISCFRSYLQTSWFSICFCINAIDLATVCACVSCTSSFFCRL